MPSKPRPVLEIPCPSTLVVGIDEVGRGCIAGPVVAAAVAWKSNVEGLGDSKKLTARARARLVPAIQEGALAWAIGTASVEEIDEINILRATFLAMKRAFEGLGRQVLDASPVVWVDGNAMPDGFDHSSTRLFIGGDATHAPIAAASILAKQWRDDFMVSSASEYPGYGFEKHMGYGTAQHLSALDQLGPCVLHRRSFAPVRQRLRG